MVMVQLVDTDEQWNLLRFFKVVKVFDKALRQTFERMWNKKYGQLHQWDDSNAKRKILCNKEGGKQSIKLLTNKSYEEWDTTALCKFTLYAKSFASRDSKGDLKTLDELYIKPRGPNPGQFHASVISANGNIDETYALAIDQLRLLRNWCFHSTREEMDKKTFNQYVKLVKDAFKALLVNTDDIDAIVNATGSAHFEAQSCDMRFFFFDPFIGFCALRQV